MQPADRVCIKITLKNQKQKDAYIKRQANHIQGTPKIILGKLQNNVQQIWIQELKNGQTNILKQLNSSQKSFIYAKTIIWACGKLASRYGNFMINQNMVFFNQKQEIFVWINPDIMENQGKIYLQNGHEGQMAMIRSIVTYLKLWLKCDYSVFAQSKNLDQLYKHFQNVSSKVVENVQHSFLNRKGSFSNQNQDFGFRGQQESLLTENKSNKDLNLKKSPGKDSDQQQFFHKSYSNKYNNGIKFNLKTPSESKEQIKNKTTQSRNTDQVSEKNAESIQHEYYNEHKSFNNLAVKNKIQLNKSGGVKQGNNYFPNKTASTKTPPHIVSLIQSQDEYPEKYGHNKIVLQEQKMKEAQDRAKKLKKSLTGIGQLGQEVNDLFSSNIEKEQGGNSQEIQQMEEQFSNLLN